MDEDETTYSSDSDEDYVPEDDEESYEGDDDADPSEENEEVEDGQDSAAPGPEGAYRPAPTALGPIFSQEAVEAYAEQMGMSTEQVAVATHLVEQILAHHNAADAVTNSVIAQEASRAPDFYSEYGARVRQHLSRIPAEQRGQRRMVQVASVLAYLETANETDDLVTVIGNLAQKLGARRPAAREREREPEREPERPRIPPERRTPQPAATGSRGAPPAPRRRGGDEVTRGFMGRFGLSPIHEREVDYALKTKTGWR